MRLPLDSWVEAFAGSRAVRLAAERLVGDLAAPGTPEYRRLMAGVSVRALKASVHEAGRLGYEIVFGGIGGTAPVSVIVTVELINPRVVVARDPSTWADADYRSVLATSVAATAREMFTIPPGLLLLAFNLSIFTDLLTPWLHLLLGVDAAMTRPGPGTATTEMSGTRLVNEPTTVTRFDARVGLTRSDQPEREPELIVLPRSTWIRALRSDTRRLWADLPYLPGELGGPDNPGPVLRPPANMHMNWPPMLRLSDLDGAEKLFDTAMRMLRRHFPGMVPNADGTATRWEGPVGRYLADSRLPVENARMLREMLEPKNLAARFSRLLSPNGYPIRLARSTVAGRFGEEVVVRVRARLGNLPSPAQPAPSAVVYQEPSFRDYLPDVEMDFFIATVRDLVLSSSKIWSTWYGLQAMVGVTQAGRGPLAGVQPRALLLWRQMLAAVLTSGLTTRGLHGAEVRGAGRFDGKVVFFLTIESSTRGEQPSGGGPALSGGQGVGGAPGAVGAGSRADAAAPAGPAPAGGGAGGGGAGGAGAGGGGAGGGGAGGGGAGGGGAGGGALAVDALAAKPALPRVLRADPVPADYAVMMPAAITSRRQAESEESELWGRFSAPDSTTVADSDSDSSPTEVGDESAYEGLVFVSSPQQPFPPDALLMVGHSALLKEAVDALEEAGSGAMPAASREELENALHLAALEVNDALSGGSDAVGTATWKKVWAGQVAQLSELDKVTGLITGWQRLAEIEISWDVESAKTIDVIPGCGTYSAASVAAVQELGSDFTSGWLGGLRLRFPFNFGPALPVESAEPAQPSARQFQVSAQPQLTYRRLWTDGSTEPAGGSLNRSSLDVNLMVLTTVKVNYRLRVRSWDSRRLASHTGERVLHGPARSAVSRFSTAWRPPDSG